MAQLNNNIFICLTVVLCLVIADNLTHGRPNKVNFELGFDLTHHKDGNPSLKLRGFEGSRELRADDSDSKKADGDEEVPVPRKDTSESSSSDELERVASTKGLEDDGVGDEVDANLKAASTEKESANSEEK